MKTLIIEQGGNGGVCHYTYELASALSSNGAEVGLFTASDYELETKERNFELYNKIKWCRNNFLRKIKVNKLLNILYYLFSLLSLIEIIKRNNYKIVHIQGMYFLPMNFITAKLVQALGCKIVFTPHNTFQRYNKTSLEWFYLWLLTHSSEIIVHSQFDKERLIQHYHIEGKKIEIIPHGNYGFFKVSKDTLSQKTNEHKKRNILFFGYIRPDKGLDYLIEGFGQFLKKLPSQDRTQYVLKIVGRPEGSFQKYASLIEKYRLENHVEQVLEYIPFEEVEHYFEETDLLVLPYLEISQSGVLQLAMSFGKPLIVSNVGGLPEIITDGVNGFVVPPKNAEELAKKLLIAFKDEALLQEMGKKNLVLSQTTFSWGNISKITINLYKKILG